MEPLGKGPARLWNDTLTRALIADWRFEVESKGGMGPTRAVSRRITETLVEKAVGPFASGSGRLERAPPWKVEK